jgi:rRNA small subunit pseudouridine methyltransferase Nep1
MDYGQRSARLPKSPGERLAWRRVIVILEHCPLQVVMDKDGFELLRERHKNYHAKHKTDPAAWRPDVVHQSMLHLLDSPLNRSGRLQLFLRTSNGVLLMVDPRLRVPRSMRLFDRMMTRLLHKLKIRSTVNQLQLLRIVKNPITDHLPENTRYIRVEKGGTLVEPYAYCAELARRCGGAPGAAGVRSGLMMTGSGAAAGSDDDVDIGTEAIEGGVESDHESGDDATAAAAPAPRAVPIWERRCVVDADAATASAAAATSSSAAAGVAVSMAEASAFRPFAFVIGGMARGDVEVDYTANKSGAEDATISFGTRGMSAAAVCSLVCHAFEEAWLSEDYPHPFNTYDGA